MYQSPFLNEISRFMLARRYSKRTVETYVYWIITYIRFCGKQHPKALNGVDFERFLTHLAVNRTVSVSTQKVALNALVFLYNKFLNQPLGDVSQFRRTHRQAKLPIVLTEPEVSALFAHLPSQYHLLIGILYGSGLRRMELLRLRVHDVDKDMKQIRVWNGKGFKHRITTLAVELVPLIERRIQRLGGIWMRIYKTRILRMYGCQLQWQENIKMPIKV